MRKIREAGGTSRDRNTVLTGCCSIRKICHSLRAFAREYVPPEISVENPAIPPIVTVQEKIYYAHNYNKKGSADAP
jgi:hypothetical protein